MREFVKERNFEGLEKLDIWRKKDSDLYVKAIQSIPRCIRS
jgi:hypothetical protein